jgi:hypothetical protein
MADDEITTIGGCYVCKRTFSFVPESVTVVSIDPETGLPPGMTVLGTLREPTQEASARAVEKVVCPDCVSRAKQLLEPPAPRFETWWSDPDRG